MKRLRSLMPSFVYIMVAALSFGACVNPALLPTPTPEAAQDWQRIQESGELTVGVSADYPPFEYYDDRFRITGFDPALIREIGARLGVEVQIKDIPFDGLMDSLRINQVDVAISAISVTPERDALVDFTDVYYLGEDAFLAAATGQPTLYKSITEIAEETRIGVQRGTVYETWVTEELVLPGLLPERNLILYTDIKRAVADLQRGLIDLVIMDALPAQTFAESGGVVVVAQGLNRQRYAMAVRNGSDELRRQLNAQLDIMRDDGALEALAVEFLGLDAQDILPAETPSPTVVPTVTTRATATSTARATATATVRATATATSFPPPCIDGMTYVADLNYDDKNMTAPPVLAPGQEFVKGWRVRNSGTCTWDGRYRLAYAYGNTPAARMGGQPAPVSGLVLPGTTYDFYVPLVAPLSPGVYQGFWQMINAANAPFGQRIYVGIRVAAPATPTPRPTQTPSPQISFSASPTSIRAGDPVVFTWSTQNVREVYFYAQGQNWWEHGVPSVGTRTEYPQRTTTYFLRVVKRDNTVDVRQITIYVEQVQGAPLIALFNLVPEGQIALGQCVRIDWDVQGAVSRVDLRRNGADLWINAPVRGSTNDCPPTAGNFEYRLDATGPGGQSRAVRFVTVIQPPPPSTPTASPTTTPTTSATPAPTGTPTVTPSATPIPPVMINLFSVEPPQIELGQCFNLAWSVSGDPALIQIKRNAAVVLDNAPYGGNLPDCPGAAGDYLYRIEATGRTGQAGAAREVLVSVMAPAPTPTPTLTATPLPAAPIIDYFNLSAEIVTEGDCIMMSWGYRGESLASTRIERNGEMIVLDPPLNGEQSDCPPTAGEYIYELIVVAEFGGAARQARFLTVEPLPVQPLPADATQP